MLELPHAIVGATIAAKIGNPALSLPLAVASHFALDLLPHWNPHLNTEYKKLGKLSIATKGIISLDVIISLIVGIYIASNYLPDQNKFVFVLLGALMGVLPDLVEAPHFFLGWRIPVIEKLLKFQKSIQNDAPIVWGLLTQIFIIGACFWWLNN